MTPDRKTMTLNLQETEMVILDRLAERKGLTKTALVRQALRLYQSVEERLEQGQKFFFEHPISKEKSELLVL
jgi:hypothetical protein